MKLCSLLVASAICFYAFTATAQLPQLVKNININGDSKPANLTNYNNRLYFSANDGVNGAELWVTDGTDTGTKMFDINPGTGSSTPHGFTIYKNKLYFSASTGGSYDGMWMVDGVDTPTFITSKTGLLDTGIVYNNLLYFSGVDTSGAELWVTDGTDTGTRLVKDIYPGFHSSLPDNFIVYKNQLYFSATNGVAAPHSYGGKLVYVTDGTDTGTHPLRSDIGLGTLDYDLPGFIIYKNRLCFQGDNGLGFELWSTDGTDTGTSMVKWINMNQGNVYGDRGSHPQHMTIYGSKMYFAADDSQHGLELWVTDGTDAGTKMYQNIYPDLNYGVSSFPTDFLQHQGLLFFQAWDASGANWNVLDTPTNTSYPVNLFGNPGLMNYSFLPVVYNGTIYLRADVDINGGSYFDLFALDSIIPHRLRPAGNANDPNHFYLYDTKQMVISNGKLFYTADYDNNGVELYALKTDTLVPPTPPNAVKNIVNSLSAAVYPNPANNEVYISYTLSQSTPVSIQLCDVTGRLKKEWQQGEMTTGNHTVLLNLPQGIAPGLYFVRIGAAGNSTTLKLSISK